jgi:hypothetical protein
MAFQAAAAAGSSAGAESAATAAAATAGVVVATQVTIAVVVVAAVVTTSFVGVTEVQRTRSNPDPHGTSQGRGRKKVSSHPLSASGSNQTKMSPTSNRSHPSAVQLPEKRF